MLQKRVHERLSIWIGQEQQQNLEWANYSVAAGRKEAYGIKDQWNLKTKEKKNQKPLQTAQKPNVTSCSGTNLANVKDQQ